MELRITLKIVLPLQITIVHSTQKGLMVKPILQETYRLMQVLYLVR